MPKHKRTQRAKWWHQSLGAIARSFAGLNRVIKATQGSYAASTLPELPEVIARQSGQSGRAKPRKHKKAG